MVPRAARTVPSSPGADPLNDGRCPAFDRARLVGDDLEGRAKAVEELAGPEEKVRVPGAAEPLVADHEGLVDQNAAR